MAQQSAKDTVLSFIKAMNAEDFSAARGYVAPDMDFIGVLGTRHGADAYFADMEKMKFKYEIEKVFADDTDVCLWYTIQMGDKSVPTCGWYQLVNGKIAKFRVLFDPRPVL
jgi:limonene-1,2-epoxide hydrolase